MRNFEDIKDFLSSRAKIREGHILKLNLEEELKQLLDEIVETDMDLSLQNEIVETDMNLSLQNSKQNSKLIKLNICKLDSLRARRSEIDEKLNAIEREKEEFCSKYGISDFAEFEGMLNKDIKERGDENDSEETISILQSFESALYIPANLFKALLNPVVSILGAGKVRSLSKDKEQRKKFLKNPSLYLFLMSNEENLIGNAFNEKSYFSIMASDKVDNKMTKKIKQEIFKPFDKKIEKVKNDKLNKLNEMLNNFVQDKLQEANDDSKYEFILNILYGSPTEDQLRQKFFQDYFVSMHEELDSNIENLEKKVTLSSESSDQLRSACLKRELNCLKIFEASEDYKDLVNGFSNMSLTPDQYQEKFFRIYGEYVKACDEDVKKYEDLKISFAMKIIDSVEELDKVEFLEIIEKGEPVESFDFISKELGKNTKQFMMKILNLAREDENMTFAKKDYLSHAIAPLIGVNNDLTGNLANLLKQLKNFSPYLKEEVMTEFKKYLNDNESLLDIAIYSFCSKIKLKFDNDVGLLNEKFFTDLHGILKYICIDGLDKMDSDVLLDFITSILDISVKNEDSRKDLMLDVKDKLFVLLEKNETLREMLSTNTEQKAKLSNVFSTLAKVAMRKKLAKGTSSSSFKTLRKLIEAKLASKVVGKVFEHHKRLIDYISSLEENDSSKVKGESFLDTKEKDRQKLLNLGKALKLILSVDKDFFKDLGKSNFYNDLIDFYFNENSEQDFSDFFNLIFERVLANPKIYDSINILLSAAVDHDNFQELYDNYISKKEGYSIGVSAMKGVKCDEKNQSSSRGISDKVTLSESELADRLLKNAREHLKIVGVSISDKGSDNGSLKKGNNKDLKM